MSRTTIAIFGLNAVLHVFLSIALIEADFIAAGLVTAFLGFFAFDDFCTAWRVRRHAAEGIDFNIEDSDEDTAGVDTLVFDFIVDVVVAAGAVYTAVILARGGYYKTAAGCAAMFAAYGLFAYARFEAIRDRQG